ncbi:MAG: lysozyme [Candidatus Competibacter sp.]|nr:lysozyme [Candidatus Competibacter sp.]MDG4583379.1 lysozyme [Candidatus Competibacter sp.]
MPNTLSPSSAALELIHEFEQGPQGGMASVPYRCSAGKLTIGWGHVIRDHEQFVMPLTAAQADALLQQDLAQFAAGVNERVTVPLTQSMFDALACFAFNVGLGAFAGSTLLRLLNQRFYAAAAEQFPRWTKATDPKTGQKIILPGLSRRRAAERALFERDGMLP